jgi:hypothetical protein
MERRPMSTQTPNPRIRPMAPGERHLRGRGRSLAGAAVLWALGTGASPAQPQAITPEGPNTFTASPLAGFREPVVEALLYNPPVDEYTWKRLHQPETITKKLEPSLVVSGKGLRDGTYRLTYRIERGEEVLHAGSGEVSVVYGGFELVAAPSRKCPEATQVSFVLEGEMQAAIRGRAGLRWSRFRGQVKYLDGRWRSTYAELHPEGFASKALFYVPIGEDGRFDALLPARVYAVVNVNGAGYQRGRWSAGPGTTT